MTKLGQGVEVRAHYPIVDFFDDKLGTGIILTSMNGIPLETLI